MYGKKIIAAVAMISVVTLSAAMFAAFEAHVINVTAKIENALSVPIEELDFGLVFPQETPDDKIFNIALSRSFIDAVGTPGGNLILNGSFENPEVTDVKNWELFPSGTTGLEWIVEWVNPATGAPDPALQELQENIYQQAQDGDQYAELDTHNNDTGLVKIHQNVSTAIGESYTLTYHFAARPGYGQDQNVVTLKINGVEIETQTADGTGETAINWMEYSYTFTANSTSTKIEFVGGGIDDTFGVFLDNVSLIQSGDRAGIINYIIRQKPKCVAADGSHPQVTHNGNEFSCPSGSTMMPLLCPYLSKHSYENESEESLTAFHGMPGVWTPQTTEQYQIEGTLSIPAYDESDTWNIDLKVPCFEGKCAQDWNDFVTNSAAPRTVNNSDDYKADPLVDGEVFGCDLWVEVTGIN